MHWLTGDWRGHARCAGADAPRAAAGDVPASVSIPTCTLVCAARYVLDWMYRQGLEKSEEPCEIEDQGRRDDQNGIFANGQVNRLLTAAVGMHRKITSWGCCRRHIGAIIHWGRSGAGI
eukprot:354083-Chlamydomonas_euryale.AAC.3